jgi:serralysin
MVLEAGCLSGGRTRASFFRSRKEEAMAVPTTPTPTSGSGHFKIIDTTTDAAVSDDSTAYPGPVAGIQWQFITTTTDNLAITATSPNTFIHTGSGTGAIDVSHVNGTNVLDGSTGSNFLVGGSGFDTFFVDDRNLTADVFSTVVGFHSGDNATIFGVTPDDFKLNTFDNLGAVGFKGLDFGFSAAGKANANLVLTGFTGADLTNGRLTKTFGTNPATAGAPASTFMLIHAN